METKPPTAASDDSNNRRVTVLFTIFTIIVTCGLHLLSWPTRSTPVTEAEIFSFYKFNPPNLKRGAIWRRFEAAVFSSADPRPQRFPWVVIDGGRVLFVVFNFLLNWIHSTFLFPLLWFFLVNLCRAFMYSYTLEKVDLHHRPLAKRLDSACARQHVTTLNIFSSPTDS